MNDDTLFIINNIDHKMNDIDDEPMCGCGLCSFAQFAIKNYTNFLICSSILELLYGYIYCNSMIYAFGYINLIYVLRLFGYNVFSNMLSVLLLPFYYRVLFSIVNYKPNIILEFITSVCVATQVLLAGIKTILYLNKFILTD